MKNLYDGLDGYLTKEAKAAKEQMVKEVGLDPDLAHTIIEVNCEEEEMYDLEGHDDHE